MNFKKLAVLMGATAAVAMGSSAANAAITSVPAAAQLVPLFYFNSGTAGLTAATGTGAPSPQGSGNGSVDTIVRVIVPRSVGTDTVINILSDYAYGGPIAPSTKWAVNSNGSAQAVHYFWMDNRSVEIANKTVNVSSDQELFISAAAEGALFSIPSSKAGYLILTNDSAFQGGAPNFLFAADAWLVNNTYSPGLPSTISIPVFGMNDAVDTASTPTPSNNVVESHAYVTDPVASPIHTAIRTNSTTTGNNLRVVDVPLFDNIPGTPFGYNNILVAWSDRNDCAGYTNISVGYLSTACANPSSLRNIEVYGVNTTENQLSLPWMSLANQLNFVAMDFTFGAATNAPNLQNNLSDMIGVNDAYGATYGQSPLAIDDGFVKLILKAPPLPAASSTQGSYASVILFNIPVAINTGYVPGTPNPVWGTSLVSPQLGNDTGFFSTAQ